MFRLRARMRATLNATELLATTAVATVLLGVCGGYLAFEPADLEAQVAPTSYLNRSSDDSSLAALSGQAVTRASGRPTTGDSIRLR